MGRLSHKMTQQHLTAKTTGMEVTIYKYGKYGEKKIINIFIVQNIFIIKKKS